jgi:hypothetical membrane protein
VRFNNQLIAGVLLLAGSVQFVFGMSIAEYLYPGYSASKNFISDLGATCRETCIVYEPSASIFNSSVSLLGLLVLASSYFFHRSFRKAVITILLAVTGVGAVGVGVFPETAGVLHSISSLITFLAAGLAVISTALLARGPIRYFGILMGITTLTALALFLSRVYMGLGPGGMERMIVFPALLWGAAFGAYISNTSAQAGAA